jgi:hypothetical protein
MQFTLIRFCALIALASPCVASEKIFFGRWEPPESLYEFWKPIHENWWDLDDLTKFRVHGQAFARKSRPQDLIDDIMIDLKKHPSVRRTFVYSMLIVGWNPKVTLRLLRPYTQARDADLRKIADDFIADIEEYRALPNQDKR